MRRALTAISLTLVLLVIAPTTTSAQAKLVRSDPGPGAILSSVPPAVQLWFDGPVELTLSKVELVDPAGRRVTLGEPAQRDEKEKLELQIRDSMSAGTYTVSYHTIGQDGRPTKGSYTFRVLGENEVVDTAFSAAAARAQRDSAAAKQRDAMASKPSDVLEIRTTDPIYVAARFLSFTLLLILLGGPLFWLLILRRTAELDVDMRRKADSIVTSLSVYVALTYVAVGILRLYLQTRLVSGNDFPDASDLSRMLGRTNWGRIWQLQMAAALALVVVYSIRRHVRPVTWRLALPAVLVLALTTSLVSHAGASHTMRFVGVLTDSLHMLAVGAWLGGVFWLLVAAMPALGGKGERRMHRLVALLTRFSTMLLASVAIVVFTGLVSAGLRVGTLQALAGSSYGQALLVKLTLAGALTAVAWYNWRIDRPLLDADAALRALKHSAGRELAACLFVIIVTALLVALPAPVSG
jgi:copper transport protein